MGRNGVSSMGVYTYATRTRAWYVCRKNFFIVGRIEFEYVDFNLSPWVKTQEGIC